MRRLGRNGGSVMTASVIDELLLADAEVIEASDTIRHARRRMEYASLRSLIVIRDNQPIGIVKWPTARKVNQDDMEKPVTDFMASEFPTFRQGQPVNEAQSLLGHDVNIEQIPVVSESGEFVGAVHRETLGRTSEPQSETSGAATPDTEPVQTAPVHEGMSVKDASGSKLGSLVEADFRSDGNVEFFVVEHGLIFKKQKRLPGDLIREIEGDDVQLRIESMEFEMMRNLGEEAE